MWLVKTTWRLSPCNNLPCRIKYSILREDCYRTLEKEDFYFLNLHFCNLNNDLLCNPLHNNCEQLYESDVL